MTLSRRLMPLTDEQWRILIAIRDGRFGENRHGRYVIDGEVRPDRRERERVFKRGYVCRTPESGSKFALTSKGRAVEEAEVQRRAALRGDRDG